jgi:hypothetical protein
MAFNLYGVRLEPWNLVYKIWELFEFYWYDIPFWYESDWLWQVLIPTLVTIANNLQIISLLYGLRLGHLEPVYKIWEVSELVWSKLSLVCIMWQIQHKWLFDYFFSSFFYSLCYWYIIRWQQIKK